MDYYITSICYGPKYTPIKPKWTERIQETCKRGIIQLYEQFHVDFKHGIQYAWWDIIRMEKNVALSKSTQKPIVQIDMDIIIEKDIQPLVELEYDFIISTEIGGNKAFPAECSQILGFGVCSGFYIIKPTACAFLVKILSLMKENTYNSYSDQVNLMKYVVHHPHTITDEEIKYNGISYHNKIIRIENITICVLDFQLVIRDPVFQMDQFANHINIDNVNGVAQFLRYFDEPLENLPLTCRCGKAHLGDTSICPHIEMRKRG